eukprot:GCRY01001413.1.p1 GENE.GCRY01001413.1~~GCRY01001413.1.p1  ORF type:complete len:488 (+),score=122.53 GCRY01001413.1:68-1531(+)
MEQFDQQKYDNCVKVARENNIILPTFEQLAHPELVPEDIKEKLKNVGLWDINPLNLFRITWKNEQVESGGQYKGVNYIELPSALTGVKARVFLLCGKFFPTGAHKVGACYGPLVGRMVTGRFDPLTNKALWPSTGNYCRGGAYLSRLLGGQPIAVLPAGMSQERFDWLKKVDAEIHATPGCESNVKEVFDKAKELETTRAGEVVVMNQFGELDNPLFHYYCTGRALEEVFENNKKEGDRFFGIQLTQGSAGTLASADYIKEKYPRAKLGVGESMQCPTLMHNGFGDHRIEGIGDKHVPWVHNVKNMDMVVDLDDEDCMRLLRLFNEPNGQKLLLEKGVPQKTIDELALLGISGIANLLGVIKMAKYYECTEKDCLFSVATDSVAMYQSRLTELKEERGEYTPVNAHVDWAMCLEGQKDDNVLELRYVDRKRMHNLKYYTWIEQQGKTLEELNNQWYQENYWTSHWAHAAQYDEKIKEFNKKVGLGNF